MGYIASIRNMYQIETGTPIAVSHIECIAFIRWHIVCYSNYSTMSHIEIWHNSCYMQYVYQYHIDTYHSETYQIETYYNETVSKGEIYVCIT